MNPLATLIRRELREHRRVALVALLCVGGGLLFSSRIFSTTTIDVVGSGAPMPLSLFTATTAAAGFMIGIAMVIAEAGGDARAFLVHRPVSATTLFASKAIAGTVLYLAAALIPFVLHALWLATPGRQPMPFDARMLLPDAADLTAGLAYLAAGMLMQMREPRWFAGRILCVGAAIVCSIFVIGADAFWQAELVVVAAVLTIGVAAWSTFVHHGGYETQPIAGRASSGVIIALGLTVAGVLAYSVMAIVAALGSRNDSASRFTQDVVTSDGTIARLVREYRPFALSSDIVAVNDLAGHPLPAYRDSAARANLVRGVFSTVTIPLTVAGWAHEPLRGTGYRGTEDLFVPLLIPGGRGGETVWYFVRDRGLIAGYDLRTGRQIGWLGPDGFQAGLAEPAHRFAGTLRPYSGLGYLEPLVAFPRDVYRLDLPRHVVQHVFSAPAGEEVTGAAEGSDSVPVTFGRVVQTPAVDSVNRFEAVATTRAVYVQSLDGRTELVEPHDASVAGYGGVAVSRATRAPGAPTFFEYDARNGTLEPAALRTARHRILERSPAGGVVDRFTLPPDSNYSSPDPKWQRAVSAVGTPIAERAAEGAAYWLSGGLSGSTGDALTWLTAVFAACVCGAITFVIGRRYAFPERRLATWMAIGAVFGLLGVTLMLSLVERPAREACPSCGKQRVVTRDQCEHCDAPFAPPAADGTEIFETGAESRSLAALGTTRPLGSG